MNGGEQCHGARDPRLGTWKDSEGRCGPCDSKATKNTQPCGGDIQQCEAGTQSLHVIACHCSRFEPFRLSLLKKVK